MTKTLTLIPALLLVLAACGGDVSRGSDSGNVSGDEGSESATSGGGVVDPQPPGQATASVEGQEFTFVEPGALDCSIAEDAITFSFRIGDNEITLGGGANHYDEGWFGSIDLRVANPEGEDGPVSYFPDLAASGDSVAVDGNSMSYSGPMQKQPPNDGSNPSPVDVGDGTISVTCT